MERVETGPLTALVCLREALDALGDTLVAADVERLTASEIHLGQAVAGARSATYSPSLPGFQGEVDRLWSALERCRRLGASLDDIVGATLVAHGQGGTYDRHGQGRSRATLTTVSARG